MEDPRHCGSCHWFVSLFIWCEAASRTILLQSSPAFLYSSLFWVSIFSAGQAYQLLLKVTHATWNLFTKAMIATVTAEFPNFQQERSTMSVWQSTILQRVRQDLVVSWLYQTTYILGRAALYFLWNRHLLWINTCFTCLDFFFSCKTSILRLTECLSHCSMQDCFWWRNSLSDQGILHKKWSIAIPTGLTDITMLSSTLKQMN